VTIRTDLDGGVFVITIDNPDRMNALGPGSTTDIAAAWQRARDDDDIRVVIFTAVGERAFCTGMDLSGASDVTSSDPRIMPLVGPIENEMWKPVIVAVNGVCAGAGLHFVAEGDIVIAASNATFVESHVTVGQVAGFEPVLLSRRMPFEAVSRMVLLGRSERLNAEKAKGLGLVSEVVESAELMPRANELAQTLLGNSLAAMMSTKRALWESLELPLTQAMARSWELIVAHWDHPDATEGPRAFVEKRPPQWQ
jgi:enoyl-CoA hydratase/carnithine racemase